MNSQPSTAPHANSLLPHSLVEESLRQHKDIIIPIFVSLLALTIFIVIKIFKLKSWSSLKYGHVMIKTGLRKRSIIDSRRPSKVSTTASTSTAFENNSLQQQKEEKTPSITHKLSDIVSQSKNLADFFQRVSGKSFFSSFIKNIFIYKFENPFLLNHKGICVLQKCKYGSCQYAGVMSAIDAMKTLKEHGVDPLDFFGIRFENLQERILDENDALQILTIQLAALTSNDTPGGVIDYSSMTNTSSVLMKTHSTTSLPSVGSHSSFESTENLSVFYATSSPLSSPMASPRGEKSGFEYVTEENNMKFSNIQTVDEVFKTMRDSSFDLWTVSRLAFQSAFNRELNGFINPTTSDVPADWLTREMTSDTASSFRTGMECFILEQMGFIKNIDDALQDFQT
ncbi:hypothetical protein NAEGRDRAFT_79033 [Naegleria gruberi]|uniref:Uncharacterized protein n=1 Tax=Naegleria gruberi TaxID=5762 RepID=D2V8S1_NAEGR|nr:uncharacterized protein NAEGRDRAFT_79033 [Naegleria gruberi]EFC46851.1 hypothetical protein NAEGRDRAFT_79033 [Naegleria gruberi]|eukprot:XP_002679595.1 hypothetical protein NAEGRDRAFT_79033 [Naegleria gruberi strain NEG-M]